MIRFYASLLFLVYSFVSQAQNLDEIKSAAGKNQWEKAKSGIENWLSNPTNAKNPDGWYLKSLILYKIISNAETKTLAPKGHRDAFDAYKKYLDLRSTAKQGIPPDHEVLFGVCFNTIEKANSDFQFKHFNEALNSFLDVEEMENYISRKGLKYQDFSFPAFDTQLYVNIAAAAISARREDVAIAYYRKIADQKIASKGFDGIYRFLVDRFDKAGDKSTRDKYLAIGKSLYPEDHYWCQVALKDAGNDRKKLFAKYEELINNGCRNYVMHYNYAVALYNYCFKQDGRPAEFVKYHSRIPEILKAALAIENTADANLLMCRYQLLLVNDLIDAYNATQENTADKLRKKDALNNQINQRYEEVLIYAGNALQILEAKLPLNAEEKENYKTAARMLSDYWDRKKDKAKADEYREKLKTVH